MEVKEMQQEVDHHLYGQKPKKAEEDDGSFPLELADILFIVLCFANSLNIDLEKAFQDMMEKYRRRDSERWTPVKVK